MEGRLKLLFVAGARPNFMKIAPLIRECEKRKEAFEYVIVHTGQHYDEGMSSIFFSELDIPEPHYYLNAGGGGHSEQTAKIMTAFDPVCVREDPDCVVVVGDVNSTLACAIVSKKLHYPVAHVEAGLRSGDRRMPEEINRLVTDSITDYFFVTEQSAVDHLMREGHSDGEIFFVGHVMIDNLLFENARLDRLKSEATSHDSDPYPPGYGVVTLHRPSNVDNQLILSGLVDALIEISHQVPLIFPVHPRTRNRLSEFGLDLGRHITMTEPLGYREFLAIWRDARLVLTDSGGLQEETTALGIPCLTLRENTERPITVELGTNILVGTEPKEIVAAAGKVLAGTHGRTGKPPMWDGKASGRILDAIASSLLN